MHAFGGQQRKSGTQIKAHLPSEYRASSRASAITTIATVFLNVAEQVQIRVHNVLFSDDLQW